MEEETKMTIMKTAKQKVKEDLLMAMYRSVDRQNEHYANGNISGIIAERFYQENLRKNFEEIE